MVPYEAYLLVAHVLISRGHISNVYFVTSTSSKSPSAPDLKVCSTPTSTQAVILSVSASQLEKPGQSKL